MNTRTITIRLTPEFIQRIDEKCNTGNQCRSDFIKNAISKELQKSEPVPEVKVTAVSYDDGKTWIDV
ncbi:ribbon-helix-helix domain-containing protein [Nitrosopumilus sp. S6]